MYNHKLPEQMSAYDLLLKQTPASIKIKLKMNFSAAKDIMSRSYIGKVSSSSYEHSGFNHMHSRVSFSSISLLLNFNFFRRRKSTIILILKIKGIHKTVEIMDELN